MVVPWQPALNAVECLRRYLELPDQEGMDSDTARHLATTAREACALLSIAIRVDDYKGRSSVEYFVAVLKQTELGRPTADLNPQIQHLRLGKPASFGST